MAEGGFSKSMKVIAVTIKDFLDKFKDTLQKGYYPSRISVEGKEVNAAFEKQRTGFGEKTFFKCPICESRKTKLYLVQDMLVCQGCITYQPYYDITHRTKNGYMSLSYRMEQLAEKYDIDIKLPFCYMDYPKPKYKHSERWCEILSKLQALENMRNQAIFFNKRYSTKVIQSVLQGKNILLYVCELYDLHKYFYDWDAGYVKFPDNKGDIKASGVTSDCTHYQNQVIGLI